MLGVFARIAYGNSNFLLHLLRAFSLIKHRPRSRHLSYSSLFLKSTPANNPAFIRNKGIKVDHIRAADDASALGSAQRGERK